MCEYNLNKPEEEKLQYVGVDCQYNKYHPQMVKEFLFKAYVPFIPFAGKILDEADTASQSNFESYTAESFNTYLKSLDDLEDSIIHHSAELINNSSLKEYELNLRTLKIIKQVSEVKKSQGDYSINYRDKYMAENTAWFYEFFKGKKMVLWAHNAHIANNPYLMGLNSMGRYLKNDFPNDYATIGFLFSRGTFTAIGMKGEKFTKLEEQRINVNPQNNSLNYVMAQCKKPVFVVNINDLQKYSSWKDSLAHGMPYFQIGAAYNNTPSNFYGAYNPDLFDYIIYFNESTASVML